MPTLLIRKVDEALKRRLRVQAARKGRSMEEEARRILAAGVEPAAPAPDNIADAIRRIVDPIGGVDLQPLPRGTLRDLPRFDEDEEP